MRKHVDDYGVIETKRARVFAERHFANIFASLLRSSAASRSGRMFLLIPSQGMRLSAITALDVGGSTEHCGATRDQVQQQPHQVFSSIDRACGLVTALCQSTLRSFITTIARKSSGRKVIAMIVGFNSISTKPHEIGRDEHVMLSGRA